MKHAAWWLALLPVAACGQQGYLPLDRFVDDPATAWFNRPHGNAHGELRPYLREDLPTDSLWPPSTVAFLDRLGDPSRHLYGGPLVDAAGGMSTATGDGTTWRAGAGAWLEWNATPRLHVEADLQAWQEVLPAHLEAFRTETGVLPGIGKVRDAGHAVQYLDWNGHVDYKAGKYFHFTLGKGRHFIGDGYRSLFLSNEARGYPFFKITTTAWRIRYQNLYAMLDGLDRSEDGTLRSHRKFTSSHYLSWNVGGRVTAGFFEAIVWQDNDPAYPRGFELAYLNPVIFYRPVEFGLGSPDNALLGAALGVKPGRGSTLLYAQFLLDEFLLANVRAGNGWYGNKQGLQLGAVAHDAFCVQGLLLRGELNYVRPFLYSHIDPRQNWAQYGQPLAHPYGSGFLEWIAQGEWRRGPWWISNVFSWAVMGQDSTSGPGGSFGNDIFLSERDRALQDATHARDFGYYVGQPLRRTALRNELRAGHVLEPRAGLALELSWLLQADAVEGAPSATGQWIQLGISTGLHARHPFQVLR